MRCSLMLLGLLTATQTVWAQAVAVQQPVVSSFSTSTTVSVPVRGSILLGGVDSAASTRVNYGPFRLGSSLGLDRQSNTMSVNVYIHDLRAMDEALLATATGDDTPGLAEYTAQMSARYGRSSPAAAGADHVRRDSNVDVIREAQRFEDLARAAEARGKPTVAKLHWRMAAKYCSPFAAQALVGKPPAVNTDARGDSTR